MNNKLRNFRFLYLPIYVCVLSLFVIGLTILVMVSEKIYVITSVVLILYVLHIIFLIPYLRPVYLSDEGIEISKVKKLDWDRVTIVLAPIAVPGVRVFVWCLMFCEEEDITPQYLRGIKKEKYFIQATKKNLQVVCEQYHKPIIIADSAFEFVENIKLPKKINDTIYAHKDRYKQSDSQIANNSNTSI